eukprot:CAMPEP_0174332458 /NCGR_PEP_ID=MMETSP0810-20121108/18317_1 /TAXON_ID=73025 ORGANISM="Eutreptiella gymnastica-like, Strain CCMP1594" /NCGR_SAMPLE_ID=MMETSP0810 /ASSEMBLY_ACC=CAM_ASM_000659 /LENGTH=45 /DNA_ID= /DNA_START= /DNA_END= /DNA_ORIENTATION=
MHMQCVARVWKGTAVAMSAAVVHKPSLTAANMLEGAANDGKLLHL